MYSFVELKKLAKKEINSKEIKVAILGNCSTQFITTGVLGYAKTKGLNIKVFEADYNAIDNILLDRTSDIYNFSPKYVILWLDVNKIYDEFLDLPTEEKKNFANSYIKKIESYWDLISNNLNSRIIQPNFTEINDRVLGNYSCKIENTFIYQLRKLNYFLEEKMSEKNYIYPLDLLSIQIQMGNDNFFDPTLYFNSKMPFSINAVPYVSKNITDILLALEGKTKKCVILDLDNTLWGGTIGDLGIGGIEIGELKRGMAFSHFQRWIKQLKEAGIILAVCSKNYEDVAKEPFEKAEEMVLKLSDISVFVANWENKASNIKFIQEVLNIGMDSLVFIDDNPYERDLVKKMLPAIEVPNLPEDAALYLDFIQKGNYFEVSSYTKDGALRTQLYKEEFERKNFEKQYESIDDYLKSLNMEATVTPFKKEQYARIAQLTQRSNQFNLTTIRYNEKDIEQIANSDEYLTLAYSLKDSFGSYGLISVMIIKKLTNEKVYIETWLMSCRVLKRGMEEFIINYMVKYLKAKGFKFIESKYIKTEKNNMVKDIFKNFGFVEVQVDEKETKYELVIDNYTDKETYIGEDNE